MLCKMLQTMKELPQPEVEKDTEYLLAFIENAT